MRAAKGEGEKCLPIFAPTDKECGGAEKQEIAEQHDLFVFAAAHEGGGEESAEKREKSDALGIAAKGEIGHEKRDEDESEESDLAGEESVVLTASPDRDEECSLAEAGDAFGEVRVVAGQEPVAPREHEQAQNDADGDTA